MIYHLFVVLLTLIGRSYDVQNTDLAARVESQFGFGKPFQSLHTVDTAISLGRPKPCFRDNENTKLGLGRPRLPPFATFDVFQCVTKLMT